MRALTLTQPWCGLVASGIKRVENRPRQMIRAEDFGVPFALHASRVIDHDVYDRIDQIAPGLTSGVPPWLVLSRYTSAVIGVATIDKVFHSGWDADSIASAATTLSYSNGELLGPDQVRWFFGPVGYVLRDIRALATPVPCRGWQGFWTLPDETERAVTAQLARAA